MKSSRGLTLVELLVALVVLALGVLAAANMQVGALNASSGAAISRQLTKLASAELELQRQLAAPTSRQSCLSGSKTGYTCVTTVLPCSLTGTTFVCAASASPVVAYKVRVVTNGPRAGSFTLSTLLTAQTTP